MKVFHTVAPLKNCAFPVFIILCGICNKLKFCLLSSLLFSWGTLYNFANITQTFQGAIILCKTNLVFCLVLPFPTFSHIFQFLKIQTRKNSCVWNYGIISGPEIPHSKAKYQVIISKLVRRFTYSEFHIFLFRCSGNISFIFNVAICLVALHSFYYADIQCTVP